MEDSKTPLIDEDHKANSCPLCNIPGQEVLAEFPRWRLARTKTMKQHRERLMLYFREHVKTLDEQSIGEAYMLLLTIGRRYFSYTDRWAVFEPVYATVPDHWHRVASDLNPVSEDYEQILKTPRLIIHTDQMTIERARPESLEGLPETPPSAGQQETRSSLAPFGLPTPTEPRSILKGERNQK